jgi:hypothetical protein
VRSRRLYNYPESGFWRESAVFRLGRELEAPLNLSSYAPSPGTAILSEPADNKFNVFARQDWRIRLPRPKALRVLAQGSLREPKCLLRKAFFECGARGIHRIDNVHYFDENKTGSRRPRLPSLGIVEVPISQWELEDRPWVDSSAMRRLAI